MPLYLDYKALTIHPCCFWIVWIDPLPHSPLRVFSPAPWLFTYPQGIMLRLRGGGVQSPPETLGLDVHLFVEEKALI